MGGLNIDKSSLKRNTPGIHRQYLYIQIAVMVIIVITSLMPLYCNAQFVSVCRQSYSIVKTVERYHVEPRPVDDRFSELVFNTFIKMMDPEGLVLTKEDLGQLEEYKLKIDDEILNQDCNFITNATRLFKKHLEYADSLVNSLKYCKFSFDKIDTVCFVRENPNVTNNELPGKWEHWLKFQVLSSCFSGADSLNACKEPADSVLISLQAEVADREDCRIKSKMNYPGGIEQYIGYMFLNAVSMAFDPHSNYFTIKDKTQFEAMLSKEALSFGFNITRNEMGEIEIVSIMAGGPAWFSNSLNEGDVILDAMPDSGQVMDFKCLAMREVLHVFSSPDITGASFHVRKKGGNEIRVKLHKERIDVDENVIKSFIIEDRKKIGYINLPTFYSQIDSITHMQKGCANDVAKELIRLKKEGISGLIIDLRNNGGGSMIEAIRLAGIFIDYGAIAMLHTRDQEPVLLKDLDRGTIFDAPLVVLVNSFSASASELFAAAMQDYNRAVIAGSKTFGKSTAQGLCPVDAGNFKYMQFVGLNSNPEAYLNLTMSRFYRVTGKSHQKVGVIPDIIIPDLFENMEIDESQYPSALEPTVLEKKSYYKPIDPLPLSVLQARSKRRIAKDSIFMNIKKMSKFLGDQKQKFLIPLNYKSVAEYYNSKPFGKKSEKMYSVTSPGIIVRNPSYLAGISSLTDKKKEINETQMTEIKKDINIREACFIINDILELTKK